MRARYSFDNAWTHGRERLQGLEQLLDAGTIRHLEALGIGEGWRCLEVGAGGGSITDWLCRRVGPSGFVMATDLETRFLEALAAPNLEVRRHDIATDDLPERTFDLVVSRLVLEHVRDREHALRSMLTALRPGGWLLCEDTDASSVTLLSPTDRGSCELFMKVEHAKDCAMAKRGHAYCGRELFVRFRALGLTGVRAEGRVPLVYAGTAAARWKRLSVEQVRADVVRSGLATNANVDAYLALVDSADFVAQGFTVTTAVGQRADA